MSSNSSDSTDFLLSQLGDADVVKYQYLQTLHQVIFEGRDEGASASASLADRATRASRLLGVTVEPTDEWFGPSLEAQVRRRVHCIETGGFTDEALDSTVRCSDFMKILYERSAGGRADAQVLGMDDTINLTAFEVAKMAVKQVRDSRTAQREQVRVRRSAEMTAPYLDFHSTLQQAFSRSTGTLEERAADASEKLGNNVTVDASEGIFEDSYAGQVRRSLLVLEAKNPSDSALKSLCQGACFLAAPATDDNPAQDELRPEAVLATIDAIARFSRSRSPGGGQSSSDAQSSDAAA